MKKTLSYLRVQRQALLTLLLLFFFSPVGATSAGVPGDTLAPMLKKGAAGSGEYLDHHLRGQPAGVVEQPFLPFLQRARQTNGTALPEPGVGCDR